MTNGTQGRAPLGLATALLVSGCGAGVAGVTAIAGGSSGGSSPDITTFALEDPKTPPALIHIAATRAARVELHLERSGQAPIRLQAVSANPVDLAGNVEQTLSWDFAADLNEPEASFVPGVTVFATFEGRTERLAQVTVGLGNDAPELTVEDPLPEVLGVVPIRLTLSDSSDDVVAIRAEYQLASEPAGVWHPARPAGLRAGDPTPDPALVGQTAPATGRELLFFWDTDFDLADLEREVRLRFTPEDGVAPGLGVETSLFQVDNNSAPAAILQDGVLATSPDETGAIAVLFSVLDEESDPVRVLFQWRHAREEFPDLSALSRDELLALLDDPERANQREELQICREEPLLFEGRAQPPPAGLDPATHVTLAELAGSAASLLESGRAREPLLANRTLEILRAPASLEPVAAGWPANPLQAPVAALPVRSGPTALVLDAPASASWRLREIDLGNGAVVRDGSGVERVASSAGDPSALADEGERRSVLVASDLAGNWQVDRVDLATWSVTRLVSVADGTTEGGRIRAVASLGLGASLITVGGSLVRLDYTTGAPQSQHPPQAVTLLDGFETPWGIAVDPLQANRVYLAERDHPRAEGGTGRVTTLELDTYIQSPVFVREDTLPGAGLERPTSIALERHGARLLVVTDDGQELRDIEISGRDPGVVFELPTEPGPKVSLATGSDGMRILALTETNDLAVAGGMLERRSVVSYDPRSLTARVSAPFDPAPGPNSRWRIAQELGAAQSSAEGRANLFVWNSRDVPEGDVHLRIVPLDTDRGVENEAILPKGVRSFRDPKILGGLGTLDAGRGLEAVDVDHDGRLDLVASSHGFRGVAPGLAVFLQSTTGSFSVAPDMTLGSFGLSVGMLNLAAADLNADGRTDLVGLRTNFLDALICPNAPRK